jgi:hypothetical protein
MKNRHLKMIFLFFPLMGMALFGFNNCSLYSPPNEAASEESAVLGSAGDNVDSENLGLPYALLSAEQTLSSMMKVTNVKIASANLVTEYNGRYGALAAGNDLGMVNGPLMLGSTSLAR